MTTSFLTGASHLSLADGRKFSDPPPTIFLLWRGRLGLNYLLIYKIEWCYFNITAQDPVFDLIFNNLNIRIRMATLWQGDLSFDGLFESERGEDLLDGLRWCGKACAEGSPESARSTRDDRVKRPFFMVRMNQKYSCLLWEIVNQLYLRHYIYTN